MVFSGPGLIKNITEFAACVDGSEVLGINCTLNPTVWEITSNNDVPVAEQHIVMYKGEQTNGLVQRLYQEAQTLVLDALYASLWSWTNASNPEVNVDFFSTEGDAVHQILDCMFLGPYSRVNYWPIPRDMENVEKMYGPSWSRDENDGQTRAIDIDQCTGSPSMPYTCGSQVCLE